MARVLGLVAAPIPLSVVSYAEGELVPEVVYPSFDSSTPVTTAPQAAPAALIPHHHNQQQQLPVQALPMED